MGEDGDGQAGADDGDLDTADPGGRRDRGQCPIPRPPSTGSTAPVTYDASSVARKAMTAATSSGVAVRPRGTAARISSLRASLRSAVMSVSTKPGATTLLVMPRLPSSRASEREKPTRPALLAA